MRREGYFLYDLRLQPGDKVGLIACSNGIPHSDKPEIDALVRTLQEMELIVDQASTIFCTNGPFSGTPQERARELHRLFADPEIKAIFDISGGDAANQVLLHLDFDLIRSNAKPFFGYSDLSVLLNGLHHSAGLVTYHYHLRHLVQDQTGSQRQLFYDTFFKGSNSLFNFEYLWLRGSTMAGYVIGGNSRCFLKLAGTPYAPLYKDKLIFLEAMSGGQARIASYIAQYEQLGVFQEAAGLILGTFSQLEEEISMAELEEMFLGVTEKYDLPVIKTQELGHNVDAHCLRIGGYYEF